MSRIYPHLLVVGACAAMTACIEPAQMTSDTVSDTTVVPDVFVADTSCEPANCDDNDPCTIDWCDESTGTCRHEGVPAASRPMPLPQCVTADDCNDNDACTTDRCETVPDECTTASSSFCVHIPVTNCGETCETATDCNDDNPCTIDSCPSPGLPCVHVPMEGCDPGCTVEGLTAIADIANQWSTYNQPVRTRGVLGMWRQAMMCTDDGICNCEGHAALADGGAELAITWDTTGDGFAMLPEQWQCRSRDFADPPLSCGPGHAGVDYVFWGRATNLFNGGAPGAAMPAIQTNAIATDGWCITPTPAGLSGVYGGALRPSWGGMEVGFKATIAMDESGLVLRISDAFCALGSCPDLSSFKGSVPLTLLEVGGRFEADLAVVGATRLVFRYFGTGNMLMGRWTPDYMAYGPYWGTPETPSAPGEAPADQIAPPPDGTFELVRLAPTEVSSPCDYPNRN